MKTISRLLAFILALALVLALPGCGGEGGTAPNDGGAGGAGTAPGDDVAPEQPEGPEDTPDPMDALLADPLGSLLSAAETTGAQLEAAWSGSPLSALAEVLESSPSGRFSLHLSDLPDLEGGLRLELTYDTEKSALCLDGEIGDSWTGVYSGTVYMSPDFVGVYSPRILGYEYCYGMVPGDFYSQVSRSPLADSLSPEELESLKDLDEALASLYGGQSETPSLRPDLASLTRALCDGMDLTASRADLPLASGTGEGIRVTGQTTGEALAGKLQALEDSFAPQAIRDVMGSLLPEVPDDSPAPASDTLRQFVDELRTSGLTLDLTWEIAEGRILRTLIDASGPDGDTSAVLEYGEGGDVTLTVTSGGETSVIACTVSAENGWHSTVTVTSGGAVTSTLDTAWDGSTLSVTSTGETASSLSCSFTAGPLGFSLDLITLNTPDGSTELPLTLSYKPNVPVPAPGLTKNIFDLSDEELAVLSQNIENALNDTYEDDYAFEY